MTELTLKIKRPEDLELVMQLAKRLRISYSQPTPNRKSKAAKKRLPILSNKKHLEKAIQFILSYQNETPSFGDALEWQRREREDRDLRL